jgi:hypothetical protein
MELSSDGKKRRFCCWIFGKTNNEAVVVVCCVLKIVTMNAELSLSPLIQKKN